MSFVAILSLCLVGALIVGALAAMVLDLTKIAAHRVKGRRVRREFRHGWDWPNFEQELARFIRDRGGAAAAHRRR
jgi:hypothetical protein